MASPENIRPHISEIDWSQETELIKDFSQRERDALHFKGYDIIVLDGIYLRDLIKEVGMKKLDKKFGHLGIDFRQIQTMISEVAVRRDLYLPDTNARTLQDENIHNYHLESILRQEDSLHHVCVLRGNMADYVAICQWFVGQGLNMQGLPYYTRTSTSDIAYKGNSSIAIKFKNVVRDEDNFPLANFNFEAVSIQDAETLIRAAPLIIPSQT